MDTRGIWALVKTAPRSQTDALRTLFYQHVRPNPRLSVTLNASTQGAASLFVFNFLLTLTAVQRVTDSHSPLQFTVLYSNKRVETSHRHPPMAEQRAPPAVHSARLPLCVAG